GRLEEPAIQFKRNRLRTLGARRHFPAQIFDRLDRVIQPRQSEGELPACIKEAQICLTQLLSDQSVETTNGENAKTGPGKNGRETKFTEQDLVGLLRSKLKALQQHHGKFDDLINQMGRGRAGRPAELFATIIGHFERFQTAYDIINSVAFIDDYELSE